MSRATELESAFGYSNLQRQVNRYFEEQLARLGLNKDSLESQPEADLRRSLSVVEKAIENHESFGKFSVKVTAEGGTVISKSSGESVVEIGVLPLLLERYKIIKKRLDAFDQQKQAATQDAQTRITSIRAELSKIAQREMKVRLWIAIGILVLFLGVICGLILTIGWNNMEPLTYVLSILLVIGGYVHFAVKQHEFSPLKFYQNSLEARERQLYQIFGVED